MAWLPEPSVRVAPARSAMVRCGGGGIMRSSVAPRYHLGFVRHAGSVISPPRASRPQGTCESAMNAACSAGTSPANDAANFSRSRNKKPSCGGRIGGGGGAGGGGGGGGGADPPLSRGEAAGEKRRPHVFSGAGPGVTR